MTWTGGASSGVSPHSRHNGLFEKEFAEKNVEVRAYGNVLIAIAFLHGLAAEELKPEHFEYQDPDYQVLITVRAVKSKTDN